MKHPQRNQFWIPSKKIPSFACFRVNLYKSIYPWYTLTDKWILAQKLRIPKIQFTDPMKLKQKEDQSVDTLVLLRRGNKISMRGDTKTVWSRNGRKGHPVTVPPGDPSHIQSPNPDTVVDAEKCMLTGA